MEVVASPRGSPPKLNFTANKSGWAHFVAALLRYISEVRHHRGNPLKKQIVVKGYTSSRGAATTEQCTPRMPTTIPVTKKGSDDSVGM
jgi:hypothetical protein